MIDIENAKKVFKEYVSNYDINDGKIVLKYNHILRVAEISKKIAVELNLPEEDIRLAELIGLFHDIGRFEQVRRFNTFVDKDSINHGEYGVKVLFEDGFIDRFDIDEKYYRTIKLAVLNHNRKTIESEGMNENELLHCKIIRDSDKLDIYYVLVNDKFINSYGTESMENEKFSDEIIREYREDHSIDYRQMKTFGDRWVAHMAYVYDFNFKSSCRVMREKKYLEQLFDLIKFKDEQTRAIAIEILNIANQYLESNI